MELKYCALTLCFFICRFLTSSGIDCLDEDGKPIDWSIVYKLPKEELNKSNANGRTPSTAASGLAYDYLTPKSSKKGWTKSSFLLNDPESIPGKILSPLYNEKDVASSPTMHLFYNDELPNGKVSSTLGHTKGVIAFDKDKGIWLIHSVPHYPPKVESGSNYNYPHAGIRFGQTFLCISLPTANSVNALLEQLQYNTPNVYSYHLPEWFEEKFPEVQNVIKRKSPTRKTFHKTQLRSNGGTSFTSFAKSGKFNKDLYANLVAPTFKTDLIVESWLNGVGRLDSWCKGPYSVENSYELHFPVSKTEKYDFRRTHDHSKWAISKELTNKTGSATEADQKNIVCIGDINRMRGQYKRGGGTVCFEHSNVWNAFNGLVKAIETCPRKTTFVEPIIQHA